MIRDGVFYRYTRDEWSKLYHDNHPIVNLADLDDLVSLNDRLTHSEINEVYRPLLQYIDIFYESKLSEREEREEFLRVDQIINRPFVIGISGSVAVGKSTVARVFQELLSTVYPEKKVALLTTDGFLYPNKELKKRGIMHRKGFPESYDMPALLDFMKRVKVGEDKLEYPLYSHEIYDVLSDEVGVLDKPDILIMEGINVFQLNSSQPLYVSGFYDFSVYVDADPLDIKRWYMERYFMLMDLAKEQPGNYFHDMSKWSMEKKEEYVNRVWYTINLTNLVQHIEPTKERANVILNKATNHEIDRISVRKY